MSMEQIEFAQTYGYRSDREQALRNIAGERNGSLALEAANQIQHLKENLRQVVAIVEIHSRATNNNFAWAELDEAKKCLGVWSDKP